MKRALGRLGLALIGCGAAAVGLVSAWKAESPTPPLALAGVLLLAAWVGDRWESFRLSWAGNEAEVRNHRALTLVEAAVTNAVDDPAVLRRQLEEIGLQLGMANKFIERTVNPKPPARRLQARLCRGVNWVQSDLEPDERMRGGLLTAEWNCPRGHQHSIAMSGPGPDDFLPVQAMLNCMLEDGPSEAIPGEYVVRWYWSFAHEDDAPRLVAEVRDQVPDDSAAWLGSWS